MKARVHMFISGRVQGVFFRSEVRRESRRHSVTGWVRNLSDGRVEAVFEGEKRNVEKLVEFCRQGPARARVANTEVIWETYTGEFRDFHVIW